VSVLIPARNVEAFIGEQLRALSRQDYAGPWEVVVADNGSTDGTRAVIESWRDRLPAVTVVDAPDRPAVNVARNAAARHAHADLLLFTDADDVVAPGWMSALVDMLDRFDMAGGPCEQFDDRGHQFDVLLADGLPTSLGFLPYFLGCNVGVRRAAFDRVGGFDEGWPSLGGDDIDFCWRVQQAGATVGYSAAARIRYRQPPTTRQVMTKQWGYGKGSGYLSQRYGAAGARPWTAWDHVRDTAALVRDLWWLASAERRLSWVKRAGWTGGRLRAHLDRTWDPTPPG
jgi:glycosyltransferase involved in cell wall biosynthesis